MIRRDAPASGVFRDVVLGDGTRWIDMDRRSADAAAWLESHDDIPEAAVEAVTAEHTRPRSVVYGSARVVILRAVNMMEDAEPEDMLSVRIVAVPGLIATLHVGAVRSVGEVAQEIEGGAGATSPGEVVARLAVRLVEKFEPLAERLVGELDELEDGEVRSGKAARERTAALRRSATKLRRYMVPQRDAIASLSGSTDAWIDQEGVRALQEVASRYARIAEEVEGIRDRAGIVSDDLAMAEAAQMNRTMYALSLVAGVFLPISFLTGLLGMNVGGMPGIDNGAAFAIVCGLLVAIIVLEVLIFRRFRWL